MKNIRFIIFSLLFVIKTNSLLAQEEGEVYVVEKNPTNEYPLLEKQLPSGRLELNRIKKFPLDYIYEINKNIKTLIIEDSFELKSLPKDVKKFNSLEEVTIWGVSLTEFPIGFCDIKTVNFFSYGKNLTTIIPDEIGKLKNLKILYLSRMPIKEIPTEVGNLENLERLHIEETAGDYDISGIHYRLDGIHYIPKEIGNLKSLKYLVLEKNNLEGIPKEIGFLNNLTILSIKDNKLKTLPKEIWNLQNLENLILSDNTLEYLPEEIGNLKKLKILRLNNNKLKKLPKNIENLKNLKILEVKGNEIPEEKITKLREKLNNTQIIY